MDGTAKVVVLNPESFNSNDIIRKFELKALRSFANKAFLNVNNLRLPVWIFRDSFIIERDLGLLLNIKLVSVVRLITFARSVEVSWTFHIKGKGLNDLVACLDLRSVEIGDLVVLWTQEHAHVEEGSFRDVEIPEIEWILL